MAIEVTNEIIESFLEGNNPKKYVVAIESSYYENTVDLIINDPETGKRIEKATYSPFLWFKEDIVSILYNGKRTKMLEACQKYGVKMIRLRTSNDEGFVPKRMENGYKFKATCKFSYSRLIQFFKDGGIDIFKKEYSGYFIKYDPTEQFMIQTGIRLFKGMDDYDDVHRLQYDLETEGLFAYKSGIFQIGIRDNRGFEGVLETIGDNDIKRRECERENIKKFFQVIDSIRPDIITGYNSENFDWNFIFERAERLHMDVTEYAITLNRISKIKRKPAMVKFGGETERYTQTNMWGYNILDISHAVRRAMAINSDIKAWGLKYITQYSEIAKPNRVYVPGDKINTTWSDKVNSYAFNDTNGDWYMITDKKPLKNNYVIVKGNYIVQRYLYDDLWETEQIDNLFNQASFLIGKMLPTTFQRSSTMGTAGQWKLIMSAWSFEHDLAIPDVQSKRDFTGGLSRLLELGYARNVAKLDFAALYPKTQLTHLIFPDLDITGMMMGALTYIVDTRDKYKFLNGKEKALYKKLEKRLEAEKDTLSNKEFIELKEQIAEHKALANKYDKKQLPLKILANSWFGSYGAPYIFNWGDTDSAEETTCRGRQYLRLMVKFFTEKYGFKALVLDTDGCNFSFPDTINEVKYTAIGNHWKTEENAGKELSGLDAVLAEFNETYMIGRMGLDIDDICQSTINFSRKNYANAIDGKIKLVGNSIKSKKMPVYIEDFIGKAIKMLLDGDGESFINYYYDYVDKIYNYQIPLVKIASKGKVKLTIDKYKEKMKTVNKAGNPMPRQAHMELAMINNIDVTLGDVIYYINTGTVKSHGDLKTITNNPMTKKQIAEYIEEHGEKPVFTKTVQLNCKLINPEVVEKDFEKIKELEMLKKALTKDVEDGGDSYETMQARIDEINKELYTEEYNVARYLDAFNKKIKPLLVCFDMEVRNNLLSTIVKTKDKTTKQVIEKLKERTVFASDKCKLVSGIPNKPTDQDSYEDLMKMEDKEIKFWSKVDKVPNNMEEDEWIIIRDDYFERQRIAKEEGIQHEKELMENYIKTLEINEIKLIDEKGVLPINILILSDLSDDSEFNLVSRKWGEILCNLDDVYKYEKEAIERDIYYNLNGLEKDKDRYQKYLDYLYERSVMTGDTINLVSDEVIEIEPKKIIKVIDKIKDNFNKVKLDDEITPIIKKKISESESEDEESEITIDANGNIIRHAEILQLDDEIDDTEGILPEDYVHIEVQLTEEEIFTEPLKVYTVEKTKKVVKEVIKEQPKIQEEIKDEWNF